MNVLFKGGEQSSEVIIRAKLKARRGGGIKKKQPKSSCISAQGWATFHFFKSRDVVIDPSPNHTLNCTSSTNEYFNAYISC